MRSASIEHLGYDGTNVGGNAGNVGVINLVEALQRSEENFRTIIERAPLPMCVSRATQLVYANPAMLAYLGYDRQDALVGPMLAELSDEIIHPDDRNRTREAFRDLFAFESSQADGLQQAVRVNDVCLRRKSDGALRFCDMHATFVLHDGFPALVTYLHDHRVSPLVCLSVRPVRGVRRYGAAGREIKKGQIALE